MTSFINSLPCQRNSELSAAQMLRHFREKYIFVRKAVNYPQEDSDLLPRIRRSSSPVSRSDYCSWIWERDDDPERVPRKIVKAVCPGCPHFCRPVDYHLRVLVARCDKTTGEKVWKWKEKTIAISYVYDP